jgi:GcrA cell cycle regulator
VSFDWNNQNILRLRAAWAAGDSASKIGRDLGCGKNAAISKAHRLKLPGRPSPIKRKTGEPDAPKPQRLAGAHLSIKEPVPIERVRQLAVVAPTPKPVARKKCLYASGERSTGYVCCEAWAEAGSIWCSQHRARCTIRVTSKKELAA